jgi:hypothetical protein
MAAFISGSQEIVDDVQQGHPELGLFILVKQAFDQLSFDGGKFSVDVGTQYLVR